MQAKQATSRQSALSKQGSWREAESARARAETAEESGRARPQRSRQYRSAHGSEDAARTYVERVQLLREAAAARQEAERGAALQAGKAQSELQARLSSAETASAAAQAKA